MLDILIKDARVIDGGGAAARKADVGIAQGRIVVLGPKVEAAAGRLIDARGLYLAPGFIDPHTHSDLTLLADPRAESKVRQGVTTEVIGNCGSSPAPLPGGPTVEVQDWAASAGVEVTWASMGDFLERLRKTGIALNVVPLVGHNPVREAVLGTADVAPADEQQIKMARLVAEAMEQGARGFSTGFYFPPGCFAGTEEVAGLARVAARYGGVYATHIRDYGAGVVEAVSEAMEIGARSGARVQISHIKVSGCRNWGAIEGLLALLDGAAARGARVGCDQYPYAANARPLTALLPGWARAGGGKAIAERLGDPRERARLRRDAAWEERGGVRGWDDVLVTACAPRPEAVNRSIAEIARVEDKHPLETALDLIAISEGRAVGLFRDESEENVRALMRHPSVVVGSDGSAQAPHGKLAGYKRNPRAYGTFPRVLGRYVRAEGALSLEQAVQKMTSTTAERFGLADRGLVREGAWADLVLFDAGRVRDRATFSDPHRYPDGIAYVLVNGVVVVEVGDHSGALPGQVL